MNAYVTAVYRQGAFIPETACDLPDGSRVVLWIEEPSLIPPAISDPEERARVLRGIAQRMRENPIPAGAPRLTREQLHERR